MNNISSLRCLYENFGWELSKLQGVPSVQDLAPKCWVALRTLAFYDTACNLIDKSRIGIEDKLREGENCPLGTGFLGLDVKWQTDYIVVFVVRLLDD